MWQIIEKFDSLDSTINQAAIGSKPDKSSVIKKDDSNYAHSSRGGAAPVNRGKPQPNAQSTIKPSSQSVPAKPVGSNTKPIATLNQPQPPVSDHRHTILLLAFLRIENGK